MKGQQKDSERQWLTWTVCTTSGSRLGKIAAATFLNAGPQSAATAATAAQASRTTTDRGSSSPPLISEGTDRESSMQNSVSAPALNTIRCYYGHCFVFSPYLLHGLCGTELRGRPASRQPVQLPECRRTARPTLCFQPMEAGLQLCAELLPRQPLQHHKQRH